MSTTTLVVWNTITIVVMVLLVSRKYGTLLTPLTIFAGYWFVTTVCAPLLFSQLKLFVFIPKAAINYTLFLSALYFVSLSIAFLLRFSPLKSLLSGLARLSRPFTLRDSNDLTGVAIGFLTLQFIATYCGLMVASDAGWMWLTDSREAYSYHRIGVGVWWALAQADLMLLFLVLLFWRRRTLRGVFAFAVIFAAVDLLLGSKGSSLSYLVVGMFFANFCVRKIRTRSIVLMGALIFCCALALQVAQGTAYTLRDTLMYFDYFRNYRDDDHPFSAISFSLRDGNSI